MILVSILLSGIIFQKGGDEFHHFVRVPPMDYPQKWAEKIFHIIKNLIWCHKMDKFQWLYSPKKSYGYMEKIVTIAI